MAWWLTPRTPDPEVVGSSPIGSPCCVLEQKIFTPPQKKKSTGNTQEAVAPSQHE